MTGKVKAKAVRRGRTSTSRVSSKNQITIPVEIMRMVNIDIGDQVSFDADEGRIIIKKSEPKIFGLLGIGDSYFDDFDFEKERREAWGE
ncbi:MAG: AbrB/MazE/SpoVT family DNA-binding domain-containing protein [Actinomycetes bacterium]